MMHRDCQECSKALPEWAQFCPFCGEKYRATAMLHPIEGPEEVGSEPAEPVHAPIMTEILYLGTAKAAFEETARPESVVEPAKPEPAPARVTSIEPNVVVNQEALAMFDQPADDLWEDEFDDFAPVQSRGKMVVAAVAALVTVVALVAGGIVISNSAQPEPAELTGSIAEATNPEPDAPKLAPLPELHTFDVRMDGKSHASVMYDASEILELGTAKGSRYDDVETRAKSVTVRLTHIANKQREERLENARFVARANGDVYEVVWDDGSAHPFRVKDVTRHDVSKKGEIAIQANLQADALTELFRTKIAPTPIPNS